MLQPIHTPTRAASGGLSAPNDENQTRKAMHPIQSNIRIIKETKLFGSVLRKENKAEIITKAMPVKNDQRPPMAMMAGKPSRPIVPSSIKAYGLLQCATASAAMPAEVLSLVTSGGLGQMMTKVEIPVTDGCEFWFRGGRAVGAEV
jgi:hypothetical protein